MTMRQGIKSESTIGGCCKNCKDRVVEPNCHGYCEKFLKAKAEREEKQAQIKKVRDKYKDYDNFKMTNIRATKEFMKTHRPKVK